MPTNIFIDEKNGLWFGFGTTIYRSVDKTTVLTMSRIINQNIRKISNNGSILLKYSSGNEAFVDSKGNLWIIGSPYGLG